MDVLLSAVFVVLLVVAVAFCIYNLSYYTYLEVATGVQKWPLRFFGFSNLVGLTSGVLALRLFVSPAGNPMVLQIAMLLASFAVAVTSFYYMYNVQKRYEG
ncbi:MAG: hypothetical protein Q7T74_01110 [Candidatus Saccharibacteria bacterium]|nr:hypothetical protein [Candidatus Saccharibacteria bacterium]